MHFRLSHLVLIALGVLLAGAALAGLHGHGSHEGMWGHMTERCDTDGDSKITRAEFDACHDIFNKLDSDSDGAITEEEAARAAEGLHARMLASRLAKRADENADGVVGSGEWQALVARLDVNGDGIVVPEEVHSVIAPAGKGQGMRERRPGPGHGPGGQLEFTVEHLNEAFAVIDADGSGALEAGELETAVEGLHQKMGRRHGPHGRGPHPADADGDGQVTAEEWGAHFEALDRDADGVLEPGEEPRMRRRHGHGH
jgi:Ca2+-binding EF-hand superfamily protein